MGFYERRVLPRMINVACSTKMVEPLRRRVCEGLAGDVVEIGFGSGLNIPFYPAAVTRVAAVEPSDLGWQLAGQRLKAASVPVQRSGLDGQSLPFDDDSYDAALSTWTLCTIRDAAAALHEVRRVLKPRGPCTSWSMDWPPTRMCAAGNGASTHCSSACSAGANSPGPSLTC
jgi:ubiquinone/menaquinone biosynthesis C-methylase UbiE